MAEVYLSEIEIHTVHNATSDIKTEIREIILTHIAGILSKTYNEAIHDFSPASLSAHLAFKADPKLNDLRLALERMDRDDYGRCIFCKEAISTELLREQPTAHFCEQCSRILKKRTTLGPQISPPH